MRRTALLSVVSLLVSAAPALAVLAARPSRPTATSVTGVADDVGCTGSGCTDPTNAVTWPITLGAAAVKIDNAAIATGKGTNIETGTFGVAVPSNVFSGSYTSTLTVSVITGP